MDEPRLPARAVKVLADSDHDCGEAGNDHRYEVAKSVSSLPLIVLPMFIDLFLRGETSFLYSHYYAIRSTLSGEIDISSNCLYYNVIGWCTARSLNVLISRGYLPHFNLIPMSHSDHQFYYVVKYHSVPSSSLSVLEHSYDSKQLVYRFLGC